MTLHCPHCRAPSAHEQRDILGDWVVCRVCARYFVWRAAKESDAGAPRRRAVPPRAGKTRRRDA